MGLIILVAEMGGRGTHAHSRLSLTGLSITLADSTVKTGDRRKIVQVSRMMVRGRSKRRNMPGLVKLCSWTWQHNHQICLDFYEKHSNICLDWTIIRLGSIWAAMTVMSQQSECWTHCDSQGISMKSCAKRIPAWLSKTWKKKTSRVPF